jgi:hypothetical protein
VTVNDQTQTARPQTVVGRRRQRNAERQERFERRSTHRTGDDPSAATIDASATVTPAATRAAQAAAQPTDFATLVDAIARAATKAWRAVRQRPSASPCATANSAGSRCNSAIATMAFRSRCQPRSGFAPAAAAAGHTAADNSAQNNDQNARAGNGGQQADAFAGNGGAATNANTGGSGNQSGNDGTAQNTRRTALDNPSTATPARAVRPTTQESHDVTTVRSPPGASPPTRAPTSRPAPPPEKMTSDQERMSAMSDKKDKDAKPAKKSGGGMMIKIIGAVVLLAAGGGGLALSRPV